MMSEALAGRCHRNDRHEPGIDVGTDVGVHVDIPLVALHGLMHLGSALFIGSMPFPVEIDFSTNMICGGTTARH